MKRKHERAIEVRLREMDQLFDSMDPCPFYEKDLDRNAEQYIVESLREIATQTPAAVVMHLDKPAGMVDEERVVGDAIRSHFVCKSQVSRQKLHLLFGRGWISLGIGLSFLAAMLTAAESVESWIGGGPLVTVLRESLFIGGWVAMWRPLEIFLYDWWPILGQRRVYDRLSRIPVRLLTGR
ncbi:MAG TPA: hypothetical protein VIH25_02635 [Steroidobacteraceae bacterium]